MKAPLVCSNQTIGRLKSYDYVSYDVHNRLRRQYASHSARKHMRQHRGLYLLNFIATLNLAIVNGSTFTTKTRKEVFDVTQFGPAFEIRY